MKSKILLLCVLIPAIVMQLSAQQDTLIVKEQQINRKKLTGAITTLSVAYIGSMSYLQYVWYKDSERVPFHLYDDRKGYLQIDKMGHAYASYAESYFSYKMLRNAGVPKSKALLYGGTTGFILQAPIEIFDGIYNGWGFSWSDIAANTAGSLLLIGQELIFDDQLINYKFSFQRSVYADVSPQLLGESTFESLLLDYNGHSYWLSTSVSNIGLKSFVPDWLAIAVGYSGNGMYGEFANKAQFRGDIIPETTRYRQLLISPDIDWTKIPTKSKLLSKVFQAMNFIKVPAPAIEFNSLGRLEAYWLYW